MPPTPRHASTIIAIAFALSLFAIASSSRAAIPSRDALDPIEQAIQKAVDYLYHTQNQDNWELAPKPKEGNPADYSAGQWGGLTALSVDALERAGENSQQPKIANALRFLAPAKVTGTQALAMKISVLSDLGRRDPGQKQVIKRDATLLLGAAKTTGRDAGLFGPTTAADLDDADLASSNDGAFGMWAASQSNLEVPTAFWKLADKAWRSRQANDGGWSEGKNARASTVLGTARGLATLLLIHEMLGDPKGNDCQGNFTDPAIISAMKWLDDHSDALFKEPNLQNLLFTLSRIEHSAGYGHFGKIDWSKAAVANLLKSQKEDGSWESPQGPIAGTAWAILFLAKSRDPVMVNKLIYDVDKNGTRVAGNWNQRPRDAANLSKWLGNWLCNFEMRWHVADLTLSDEYLHEAPILYIAGNQPLAFNPAEKAKLKQFIQQGGLILGNADCGDNRFKFSFQELGKELFPDYPFRELPPDHLIFNRMFNSRNWVHKPATPMGLSNGARELMILLEDDSSQYWNSNVSYSVRAKPCFELFANVFRYQVSAPYRSPAVAKLLLRDPNIQVKQSIKIARIQYQGNWNPEPYGWVRLANMMHNERAIDLDVHTVALNAKELTPDFHIAHLTGTGKIQLNQAQRDELRAWIANGGTLIIDSAGGSADFTDSVHTELGAIFPEAARHDGSLLPPKHPIYSFGEVAFNTWSYRRFARLTLGDAKTPRIRGIDVAGRTAIFFSHEDLSVGLVGNPVEGIIGYEPAWASEIVMNIIAFAAKRP